MIAVYYILKAVGLSEGSMIRVALIMVYSAGSGLGFYIAKGFFDTIPKALDEAAFLDGATKFQVFTKVTIPLSKPIIVYTVLTSFLGPWLDFIFAKVICRANADYYTVAIGLWRMLEKEYIDFNPDRDIVYLYAAVLCGRLDWSSEGLKCKRGGGCSVRFGA